MNSAYLDSDWQARQAVAAGQTFTLIKQPVTPSAKIWIQSGNYFTSPLGLLQEIKEEKQTHLHLHYMIMWACLKPANVQFKALKVSPEGSIEA